MKIFKLFINALDYISYAGTPNIDFNVNPQILIEKSGHMFSKNTMVHLRSFNIIIKGGKVSPNINISNSNIFAGILVPNMLVLHASSINNYSTYCSSANNLSSENTILCDILEGIPLNMIDTARNLTGNFATTSVSFYNGNITTKSLGLPIGMLNNLNTNIRFYLTDEFGAIFNVTEDGVDNFAGLPSFQLIFFDPEDSDN